MSDKITDEKLADELKTEFARAGGVNAIGGYAVWLAVARRAKELLGDKPPINVLVKDDGTWLEFHGDGKTSLIRLETLAEGPISRTALKAWCRDYRAGAHFAPPRQRKLDPIFNDIAKERGRQDFVWGGPSHDDTHQPRDWAAFIAKQMFDDYDGPTRAAFVKAAALCVAAIQSTDRFANTPAPEVDPDAGAKAAAWEWAIALAPDPQYRAYANKDDNWRALSERHRNGWRAVDAWRRAMSERHLTKKEQGIIDGALRRSVKIQDASDAIEIHKEAFRLGWIAGRDAAADVASVCALGVANAVSRELRNVVHRIRNMEPPA